MPTPEHELARRVLARLAGEHAAAAETVAATDRALRQLHEHLAHWLGRDGRMPCSRARWIARALAIRRSSGRVSIRAASGC